MSDEIRHVSAEEILDSRGNPTLSVSVETDGGMGTFAVPAGASTGRHEAREVRDGGDRYGGRGVRRAVALVEGRIQSALLGMSVKEQEKIDGILRELDGTGDRSGLGGNTMLGVSVAVAKAAGGKELVSYLRGMVGVAGERAQPYLYMNILNGGKHAQTRLSFQEYMVVPQVEEAAEAVEMGVCIQRALRKRLETSFGGGATGVGDEGGYALDVVDVTLPLRLLTEVIHEEGYDGKVLLAIDVAASSLYQEGRYVVGSEQLEGAGLSGMYRRMVQESPLCSIEDPFEEEGFDAFAALRGELPRVDIVGDDLTTTNTTRIQEAIEKKSITALIVKPNQVGTLSETAAAIRLAWGHGIRIIVSHRSGETNDDFIADLALAVGAWGLKAGAPQRGERVAKYNRLVYLTRKY